MEWPVRSPDLFSLNLLLFGHLRSKMYAILPESLEDLWNCIINESFQITPDILHNARKQFEQSHVWR